jgi:hypothetical protein
MVLEMAIRTYELEILERVVPSVSVFMVYLENFCFAVVASLALASSFL